MNLTIKYPLNYQIGLDQIIILIESNMDKSGLYPIHLQFYLKLYLVDSVRKVP